MKLFSILISGLFVGITYGNCSNKKAVSGNQIDDHDYCLLIDTLILERYEWKTGNFYANRIIPKVVQKSQIRPTCRMESLGYIYLSDSSFNSDVKKWRGYFNCK